MVSMKNMEKATSKRLDDAEQEEFETKEPSDA